MARMKVTAVTDAHACAFLGFAKQYQKAGNLLFDRHDQMLGNPAYFLYAHTIELALKAFLRAAGLPIVTDKKRKSHHITGLYEECHALGLRIGPQDRFDIRNVIVLLEGANQDQGLRYARGKSASFPDLSWTREAVESLLGAVEPSVKKKMESDGIVPATPARFDFVFSTPTRKTKA
ncbi:MAG TPA: hypothetical protein VHW09_27120 [Bryobacteraceae bacterium]|jgi:hypothetical protein|nr:hypothetical protein [Bryobacteraceae bacterium]